MLNLEGMWHPVLGCCSFPRSAAFFFAEKEFLNGIAPSWIREYCICKQMLQFILTSAAPLERYVAEKAVEMFLRKRLTLFHVQSQYTGSVSENVGEGGRSVRVCALLFFLFASYHSHVAQHITSHYSILYHLHTIDLHQITLDCIELHELSHTSMKLHSMTYVTL